MQSDKWADCTSWAPFREKKYCLLNSPRSDKDGMYRYRCSFLSFSLRKLGNIFCLFKKMSYILI